MACYHDKVQSVIGRRGPRKHVPATHLEMELETIIIVSTFSGAWLLLLVVCVVLCTQVRSLRIKVEEMQLTGRLRVQKLKMNPDKNYAFHNPALSPDEELSRRGFSMYQGTDDDVESGRGTERRVGSS